MTDQRRTEHQRTFQQIENRVLELLWIGPGWRTIGAAAAAVLTATALEWWNDALESPHAPQGVPVVTVVMFVVASVNSAVALWLRRYRWCCAAAYCCALAAVIGIGAFWWVRTGQTEMGLSWLVLADLAALTLTLGWLTLITTPLERSQPDMRQRLVHRT